MLFVLFDCLCLSEEYIDSPIPLKILTKSRLFDIFIYTNKTINQLRIQPAHKQSYILTNQTRNIDVSVVVNEPFQPSAGCKLLRNNHYRLVFTLHPSLKGLIRQIFKNLSTDGSKYCPKYPLINTLDRNINCQKPKVIINVRSKD